MQSLSQILRTIERLSYGVAFLAVAYIVLVMFVQKAPVPTFEMPKFKAKFEEWPAFADYEATFLNRNIFEPMAEMVQPDFVKPREMPAVSDLPANLRIVGVILAKPSEIVIEDTVNKQSLFIKEGETKDGIQLHSVKNGIVSINYNGQDIAIELNK